jgi:hypothetical protein
MPPINIIQNLTHENAYDYIINYYQYGGKERIFDVGFNDKFYNEGKHEHTVVLYYLGCLFCDLIDNKLGAHIQNFVQTNDWYDFRYTWFLTCLYHDTAAVIEKKDWKTALENQKGVYLITDVESGKRYVGSAYGENMLLGRWKNYVENGHGGNKDLKELDFEYIKANFRYSILEIYKSTIDDKVIINREHHWMRILLTKDKRYGYNN